MATTSSSPPLLLLDPHVRGGVADGQAGERLGVARPLAQDPVDVGRRRHGPRLVVGPEVVDLLAEAAAQVLVDLLPLGRIGGGGGPAGRGGGFRGGGGGAG